MISHDSAPSEPITIENLPDETLEHIFSFLKLPDRKSASLVCHRWNDNAFQWKNIVVVIRSQHELEYSSLLTCDRPYKHLEIPARWLTQDMSAKFATSLESLTLFRELNSNAESVFHSFVSSTIYDNQHIQAHCSFPKLRELTLENLTFWDHSTIDRFIRVAFPALASLTVNHCFVSTGSFQTIRFSNFTTLEELRIESQFPLGSTLLQDIEMLPKLRSLDLTCPDFKIYHLGQNFDLNHITSLAIDAQFDEDFLLAVTNLFPALTSFRLKGPTQFSLESIEAAKKKLPKCAFKFEYHINRVHAYRDDFSEMY